MAKSSNKFNFNVFLAELKEQIVVPVAIDSKNERRYFLIVSEGTRTEPIYFEYWADLLPRNLLRTIDVKGVGDNTVNVVKKAIELRDRRKANTKLPDYDEVWAVYDKDDFPAEHYHSAIALATKEGIESGHSNQSFELWYVLHFQFLQNALHRSDYIKILTKQFGFKYTKNSKRVVAHLMKNGNLDQAIKWAKELEEMHDEVAESSSCPSTRIYELISRLKGYVEE